MSRTGTAVRWIAALADRVGAGEAAEGGLEMLVRDRPTDEPIWFFVAHR